MTDASTTSARMTRMQLILRKALDVSVSQASAVDLRVTFEAECRGDPELLAQFFGLLDDDEEQKVEDADELSAQILLSLRQKIETAFETLCVKYDINADLMELESLIRDAEASIQQQEEPAGNEASPSKDQKVGTKTPDEIVRAEVLRAMEDEKVKLQELLQQECAEVEHLSASIEALRCHSMQDVENVHGVVTDIGSTFPPTVDHSSHT
ncbi:40s ribosomal protein s16, partial [Globisporangium splendens]